MAREQRKLAAILAADVVGYSKLMGRDESGTLARLNAHRTQRLAPALARNGGRLISNTGDGAIVEFGSAVDALRAAIEFQQAVTEANREQTDDSQIVFRIGLHLGDLIVEGDNLYGDGVNVAVRLKTEAKPGGIVVSRAVCEAVQDRLKADLHELGERVLKNIERPIRAFAVNWAAVDWPAIEELSSPTSGSAAPPQSAAFNRLSAPRLSIVVLPFINFGGDREHEYFVDGVTESLTTDLSRLSGMLVIGGSTAFAFKGIHVDVKQLGQELGVRYTLEGSVQRSGNRMRVHARLSDAETGRQVWAERFDKPMADLFDMQDEIVAHLAGQLGTQLVSAEARRAERAPTADSLDLYFQGMSWILKGRTSEFLSRAHRYFEQALTLDPCNIDALVWKAHVEATKTSVSATDDRAAQLAVAEAALTKALAQAPGHAVAHMWLGYVKVQTNRPVQGMAEYARALELDSNLGTAHAGIGLAKYRLGRGEETEAHVEEALRLSPRDAFAYQWMTTAGFAKLLLGKDDEAILRLSRAIEINPNYPNSHFWLAASLAHIGRLDEARSSAQAGLALSPAFFRLRTYRASAPSDNPTFLAQRERVIEGLRKAGLPEA